MTRKDFQLIADTIKRCDLDMDGTYEVAATFAADLAQTSERFDRARFIAACGCAAYETRKVAS